MHFSGLFIGAAAFLIIGIFHPIVVKAEYHLGVKVWPAFLVAGLICVAVTLFISSPVLAAILGVFGFACLWSIRELFEQGERVEKGWFPKNPKRQE